MMGEKSQDITQGWGVRDESGAEIWDAEPIWHQGPIGRWQWIKSIFYPKKYLLYRFLWRDYKKKITDKSVYRILDVGCGTGAAAIDLALLFERHGEIHGIDVVEKEIQLAKEKIGHTHARVDVHAYDGLHFPFSNGYFDAVYTSDVLGHVADVSSWLKEIARVSKPGAPLAMFTESRVGKHAWVRQYLLRRGLNIDPHAEFHISLYTKTEINNMIATSGFRVIAMYTAIWPSFFLNPNDYYEVLQKTSGFPILRGLNVFLYHLKKILHPVSTALVELYSLLEMVTLGRFVESQGYIVFGRRQE